LRRADHSSNESYRSCIDQETEKRPGSTRVVEPFKKKKKKNKKKRKKKKKKKKNYLKVIMC
jgi:hypothetical protein